MSDRDRYLEGRQARVAGLGLHQHPEGMIGPRVADWRLGWRHENIDRRKSPYPPVFITRIDNQIYRWSGADARGLPITVERYRKDPAERNARGRWEKFEHITVRTAIKLKCRIRQHSVLLPNASHQ